MHTAKVYEKVANIIPADELRGLSHRQTDALEELLAELLNIHDGDIEEITYDDIEEAFRKAKAFQKQRVGLSGGFQYCSNVLTTTLHNYSSMRV